MFTHSHPPAPRGQARHSIRWLALLAASLLLHLLAVNWAGGYLGIPSLQEDSPPPMDIELLAPPPPVAPKPPPPPKPKPKPESKPKPKPVRRPPQPAPAKPVEAPVSAAPALTIPDDFAPPAPAGIGVPGTSAESAVAIDEVAESAEPAGDEAADTQFKFNPPPSAELQYDVEALREGQQWYGSGMFKWESDGASYRITGEASIRIFFKITVLNFKSEGRIEDYGVAPVLYSEKPWRKSMTNTHFQHEKHTISFSASTATYPFKGGEQDRASIMWQLASMGRGGADAFAPGARLDIVVAGARDAETWRIDVVGEEEVDTPHGRLVAWHVKRAPRTGSHDQKIDIWLAPEAEWYPVKVLYTYANGDFLDMSLSDVTPLGPSTSSTSSTSSAPSTNTLNPQ